MSEKENKVSTVDPKTAYVKVKDMSATQINSLPRYKTTLSKTRINGNLRYRIEIELDLNIHVSNNITEAVYVNTLLQWNENERRDKDGRFVVVKNCPVYLVHGVNADGSEYVFWQLVLYKGRSFNGILHNDQLITMKLLEERGKHFSIVEKPQDEEIIVDSVVD